jgi:D-inositol-3-phosphate glycosyltransferase
MSASKPRIAILSVHSCPLGELGTEDTGGMSVYIREVARQLGGMGFLVDVYTRVHDPRDEQIYELGRNARLIHLRAGREEISKLAVFCYLPLFALELESFRKEHHIQYDLVFSHYWLSGWAGDSLKRLWDVPHVTMFHTLGAVKNSLGLGMDEPELRIETEKYLVKNCDRTIAATEREQEMMVQLYGATPEKISVIPCGVNLDLFQPEDKDKAREALGLGKQKVILFVGRIQALKGVEQLIRAMSCLVERNFRLVIVGGGKQSQPEVDRLQQLARELRLADAVEFRGLIKNELLPRYYSAADVSVIPSYYESFGLTALESLACGTPVVATDVGNLTSIIRPGETGYVVSSNGPPQLAEKIDLVLSQSDRRPEISLSIRNSVAGFGWANTAGAISTELRSLLVKNLVRV